MAMLRAASWVCGVAVLASATSITSAWGAPASSQSPYGRVHTYQDWAVACDNTHRCEAAGYQADDSGSEPIALLVSREAGPRGRIEAKFMLGESASGLPLTLAVGKLRLSGIEEGKPLGPSQVGPLLPWLLKAPEIAVNSGKQSWKVSLAGVTAAMLKIDDLQGRVGTPGAVVRKGARSESSVPPALAVPSVKSTALPAEQPDDAQLAKPILAAVKDANFCEDVAFGRLHASQAQVTRLSASKVLVVTACWLAAYQEGSGAWIANDKPPYAPLKVRFPEPDGSTTDEPTFLDLDPNGRAYSSHKGRGIGDCMTTTEWGWTGEGFRLLSATSSGLCKSFAGGVPLQLWRTRAPD